MVNVLFVCLGNICRSPMAEGVFQRMVDEAELGDKITVDSAGTGAYHIGEPAHKGTREILRENGIQYQGRARQLRSADFTEFDYILAMDADNLAGIESKLPPNSNVKVGLFLDYAPQLPTREVPDPYYTGKFAHVYELVTAASEGLLQAIIEEHSL